MGDDTQDRMLCVGQKFVIGSCIRFLERCLMAQLCLPGMEPIAQVRVLQMPMPCKGAETNMSGPSRVVCTEADTTDSQVIGFSLTVFESCHATVHAPIACHRQTFMRRLTASTLCSHPRGQSG